MTVQEKSYKMQFQERLLDIQAESASFPLKFIESIQEIQDINNRNKTKNTNLDELAFNIRKKREQLELRLYELSQEKDIPQIPLKTVLDLQSYVEIAGGYRKKFAEISNS